MNWAWGGDFTVTDGGYILEHISDNIPKRRIIFGSTQIYHLLRRLTPECFFTLKISLN
jgi:hypothetical protein